MKETISLRDLCVGYRDGKTTRCVAGPLTASLHGGELTCLLGRNGVGKSTLLRTMSGYQSSLSGDILFANDKGEISRQSLSAKEIARRVGVVLSSHPVEGQLTAIEVVSMGRTPYTGFWGRLSSHDRHVVEEALKQVGILSLANRMMKTLSDGEKQKVMIAKALAQQTSIILLDEPTAYLDFPSKVDILQLLRQLAHDRQHVILLSTHDLELALRLADVLWLIDEDGQLHVGSPRELADSGDLARYVEKGPLRFNSVDLTISVME